MGEAMGEAIMHEANIDEAISGEAAFVTVDVFTTERFAGNPLAVFPDARGIDAAVMQQIAVEFGYSEITFVLPPEDPANDARVRIFTPTAEIPFAGHPNVGTAYVLARAGRVFGRAVGERLRFEEMAGIVEVEILREAGAVTGARIRAPRPLELRGEIPLDVVAGVVGLAPAAFATVRHAPVVASVGLPFVVAELADLDALGRARPDKAAFAVASRAYGQSELEFSVFLYVRTAPGRVRARMFAPLDDVAEDPATGSASGALGALLAGLDGGDGTFALTIEQGVEMGRRSVIAVEVERAGGVVSSVRIAGPCVTVMRGSVEV